MGELVTTLGAIVAALTGIWNVWWQIGGQHDRFLVGLDAIRPTIERETMMHVVSVCDHPVKLKDWGFIEASGTFHSLPFAGETMDLDSENVEVRGSYELPARNATFEMGYYRDKDPIGAYAVSLTQKRPRVYFKPGTPVRLRMRIRFRLLIQPNYFLW